MILRLVLSALVGVGIAGCNASDPPSAPPPPRAVTLVRPERRPVTRWVTLPGRVRANQEATLHAKVAGYLAALTVDKGDRVTAGQVLGEIEVPELAADRTRTDAELRVARIELERLGAARTRAPDLVVPQALDDARARVEIARANLERVETLLGYARLTAPFAAVVTARYLDPGALIPAATTGGTTGGSAVVTLMDFDVVRVRVPVPEREAALVRPGQAVRFTADVLGDREFTGTISRQSYALDANQSMLVEVDVANPDLALRPGMYVTVRIGVDVHDEALTLPAVAVLREKSAASVFVADEGVAKKTPVRTGYADGTHVEIVDGLASDAAVVLLDAGVPAAGAAITPREGR